MEAHSLAALNALAAEPPRFPVNPTEETHDALVLYISRVPGTRDVILSPFKPQRKIVSAEDIAHSLYYVVMDSHGPRRSSDQSDDNRGRGRISRKPLPDAPAIPPKNPRRNLSSISPPSANGHLADFSSQLDEQFFPPPPKPPRPSSLPSLPDRPSERLLQPPTGVNPSRRKPLGPRTMVPNGVASADQGQQDRLSPSLSRSPSADAMDRMGRKKRRQSFFRYAQSVSPAKSPKRTPSNPFTLSLIRRDPGTGNQWNVGRISSQQIEPLDTTNEEEHRAQPSYPDIDVQIATLGYAKFRGMPSKKSYEDGHESGHAAIVAAIASEGSGASQDAIRQAALAAMASGDFGRPAADQGPFSRQVAMSYTKSWTANLKEKLHRGDHGGWRRKSHSREVSMTSVESSGSESDPNLGASHTAPSKPSGYVFTSPWDGRCEFSTVHGGRGLRCHHALHEKDSLPYNPLVPRSARSSISASKPATVSELRFNLPNSEPADKDKEGSTVRESLHGSFAKLFRPTGDADELHAEPMYADQDEVVSPFDVNVGRELAGGGNHGKRAKLGKLIVYNEGLKMVDLVVATNVGIWWTAWERSF